MREVSPTRGVSCSQSRTRPQRALRTRDPAWHSHSLPRGFSRPAIALPCGLNQGTKDGQSRAGQFRPCRDYFTCSLVSAFPCAPESPNGRRYSRACSAFRLSSPVQLEPAHRAGRTLCLTSFVGLLGRCAARPSARPPGGLTALPSVFPVLGRRPVPRDPLLTPGAAPQNPGRSERRRFPRQGDIPDRQERGFKAAPHGFQRPPPSPRKGSGRLRWLVGWLRRIFVPIEEPVLCCGFPRPHRDTGAGFRPVTSRARQAGLHQRGEIAGQRTPLLIV